MSPPYKGTYRPQGVPGRRSLLMRCEHEGVVVTNVHATGEVPLSAKIE